MKKWESFLQVLANQTPTTPVIFEYAVPRDTAEQLIWRRGDHLWETEEVAFRNLADTYKLCKMDFGPLHFPANCSDPQLVDLLLQTLPEGFRVIGAQKQTIAKKLQTGLSLSDCFDQTRDLYLTLAKHPAVIACAFNDCLDEIEEKDAVLQFYQTLAGELHDLNLPCIWIDFSDHPVAIERVISLGVDGLYLTERYPLTTEEAIDRYGKQIALFGDTHTDYLKTAKTKPIMAHIKRLQEHAGHQGYAYGTGNIKGTDFPYLNFISVLTAFI